MRSAFGFGALVLAAALGFAATPAAAQGDAEAGEKVFRKCKACHTIEEGGANRVGPNLFGVVGREAGTAEGFTRYSDAIKESGITWTEENLAKFLAGPKDLVPGTRMAFAGLRKDEDIQNLIAYLKEESE